jgi:acyl-CoA synthetase (AMP-forming)/AMP-acid ligase II
LANVVSTKEAKASKHVVRSSLAPKFGEWQFPDDLVFVAGVPRSSTGKLPQSQLHPTDEDVPGRVGPGSFVLGLSQNWT